MRQKLTLAQKCLTSLGLVALLGVLSITPAAAFQFNTGNPDLRISWDNTFKYSAAFRIEDQSDKLTEMSANLSNGNQDDGDRNFDKGLISNRIDVFSEFDAVYKNFGLRLSGAAWYDQVYNQSNDNDSRFTANAFSEDYDEFTDDTRDLHGRDAELLDAFVFGYIDAGQTTTSFRLGQYAMQWGESLFFGNNGIARGGMSPVDIVKLLSVPNTQFKEIIRPVPQISAQIQIGPRVSLGAYYQFKWEESRLPASGSYFSTSDVLDEGGERLILGEPLPGGHYPTAWFRGNDMEARDSGQGGIQLRVRPGMELDLGFYAINYHDKTPQLYSLPGVDEVTHSLINPAVVDFAIGKVGEYFLVYPEDIQMYGVSASTTFGDWNLAAEVSMRCNTPLVSTLQVSIPAALPYFPGVHPDADNDDDPAYAVGRSLHANFSWLASLRPNFLANETSFLGEIAWHRRTSITDNKAALDPNTEKDAWGFRMVYEPFYRQVLPGLDLSIPLGFAYFPKGKSSVITNFGPDKGGDMSIGIKASYLDVWRCSLSYTHFYGSEAGYLDADTYQNMKQALADRDFVSFSIYRTF